MFKDINLFSESIVDFIGKELFPYIEKNYRSNGYKVLRPFFGGLTAINNLLMDPLFNAYIPMILASGGTMSS
ncbi:hypothetical protein [Sphingobacterium sp. HMA12]|uniref:hypothetical protein n=1 Tax=Sphingobacterium sp. HMA12 TaxID=2050894 RepID=UPI000CE9C722|nr:hypothetical protein [Sphingobacterium sp. HMA12]